MAEAVVPARFATCAWVRPASWRSRESCSPIASFCDSSSNPFLNFGLSSFLSSHPLLDLADLAFIFHSPIEVTLIGFGSLNFSLGRLIATLPETMRQDEAPTNKEKAQDAIGFDFELENLFRFSQMLKLAFIPNFPRVTHTDKQGGKLLLAAERELFEPYFGWHRSIRGDVKLDSEHRAVIDQPA
jgi:hypothetical protein